MTQAEFLQDIMLAITHWLPFTASLVLVLVPVNWVMGLFNHAITRFISDPFREK